MQIEPLDHYKFYQREEKKDLLEMKPTPADTKAVTGEGHAPRVARFEELYRTNPVKACREALKATRTGVSSRDRLEAINDLLGAYGTEAIRGDWQNGYWCDIVACFCNMGDTYATTVIEVRQDFDRSRFIVSTMGDFVEKNTQKLGII